MPGPQGLPGTPGTVGPQGPAGPTLSVSALVSPEGFAYYQNVSAGAFTVSRIAQGHYHLVVTGLGQGCVLPSLTSYGHGATMYYYGGQCFSGGVETSCSPATGSTTIGRSSPSAAR